MINKLRFNWYLCTPKDDPYSGFKYVNCQSLICAKTATAAIEFLVDSFVIVDAIERKNIKQAIRDDFEIEEVSKLKANRIIKNDFNLKPQKENEGIIFHPVGSMIITQP